MLENQILKLCDESKCKNLTEPITTFFYDIENDVKEENINYQWILRKIEIIDMVLQIIDIGKYSQDISVLSKLFILLEKSSESSIHKEIYDAVYNF